MAPHLNRRSTLRDVASHADVSIKTASRVFNNAPHVSEPVRQRVRAAAEALNYHPNLFAQALVRRRSHLIGLVYENPSPSFVVELQMGVLDRLRNERYRLVVLPITSVAKRAAEVVSLLRSAALDGVVLAPPASDDPTLLGDLAKAGIACARIGSTTASDVGPETLMNDQEAAFRLASYLIELGHRDVAVIRGDPTHRSSEARMRGYSDAFATVGTTIRADRIRDGLYTRESGEAAARDLLGAGDLPTAIIAQNDDMAVGALTAARSRGLSVPGDLSIVGFDDSEVSRIAWPPITTIRQPVFEMAVTATDMVIAQLEGRDPVRRIEHPYSLLIRQSAAAPRLDDSAKAATRSSKAGGEVR